MADVLFVRSHDKARVAPLVARSRRRAGPSGGTRDLSRAGIRPPDHRELKIATAVLVVWTELGGVALGARRGARGGGPRHPRPGTFQNANLPIDVRAIHTTDLDDWATDAHSPQIQELLRALGAMIARRHASRHDAAPATLRVGRHHRRCAPRRDLRAAVRQHERRSRAGVFQRRHQRGHHHRPEQGLGAVGRRRATARSCSRASRSTCRRSRASSRSATCSRAACARRRPRSHHRPAGRRVDQRPRLGRTLRSRPERHLCAAGRDLAGDRQGAEAEAAARGKEGHRAARHG